MPLEVTAPDKHDRRRRGKNDYFDAESAAHAALVERHNVFVERLWRSIKFEEVYLHAYDSVSVACTGLRRYMKFYNMRKPHSSLDGQTPD